MSQTKRLRLRPLQEWMAFVMRHPATADVAVRTRHARARFPLHAVLAGEVVKPNERMSVTDRLQVYNGGYLARLREVLASDYGVLQHLLGEARFAELVARYVDRHPSRHPNLNQLGKDMPGFVARQRDLPHHAFAVEVARLERLVSEAFDAPAFTPLAPERLAAVPQAAWGRTSLVCNPSVRLAAFTHPVNAYYIDCKEGRGPRPPRRRRTHVAVFRRDQRVFRLDLEEPAHAVLAALHRGVPLGRALARARAADAVGRWFQTWAADGVFSDLLLPRPTTESSARPRRSRTAAAR